MCLGHDGKVALETHDLIGYILRKGVSNQANQIVLLLKSSQSNPVSPEPLVTRAQAQSALGRKCTYCYRKKTEYKYEKLLIRFQCSDGTWGGGLMVSALGSELNGPGSRPGRGAALCSWARHFTLTVPLSTQVYKWVPANLLLGG